MAAETRNAKPVREFRLRFEKGLPVRFESLHCAPYRDALCIAGLDEDRRARLLTVDRDGGLLLDAPDVPLLDVSGVARCGDGLAITGAGPDDRAEVVGISPGGAVAWNTALAAGERFQHWPRPIPGADGCWLVGIAGRPALRLFEVAPGGLAGDWSIPLADDSGGMDAAAGENGILLARVHGDGRRLELLRFSAGAVQSRVDIDAELPAAPSVAHTGGGIALAWVAENGEARLQHLDSSLAAKGAAQPLSPPSARGIPWRVQLVGGDAGCAVLFHLREIAGDSGLSRRADGKPVPRPPRRLLPLYLGAFDAGTGVPERFSPVSPDAILYASCWTGGRLAVVHRAAETVLSVFELVDRQDPV
jgi:hypothetical protein